MAVLHGHLKHLHALGSIIDLREPTRINSAEYAIIKGMQIFWTLLIEVVSSPKIYTDERQLQISRPHIFNTGVPEWQFSLRS